ncbi:MAG: hypothetical protein KUG64_06260 [Cycloclasticus sp.]|nr:hypothetical protein [Cycloclasticus sp.]
MKLVHKYINNQPIVWFHKKKEKSNQFCLYCGTHVGFSSEEASNKEHLIGRQFVPSGAFQEGKGFNLIFRACEVCNSRKAEIERHISSVTLLNGIPNQENSEYVDRAIIKASKDFHPLKQGVLVKDASDKQKFNFNFGSMKISFESISPPQLSQEYIKALSFYHIQGFFSLLTSSNPEVVSGTKLLPEKNFWFHGAYTHGDWGNAELMEIAKRIEILRCNANISTADGNFKVLMCHSIKDPSYWFWALEWNKNLRVVGGIYSPKKCPPIFDDLPIQQWKPLGEGSDGAKHRIREEIPLDKNDDILFSYKVYQEK